MTFLYLKETHFSKPFPEELIDKWFTTGLTFSEDDYGDQINLRGVSFPEPFKEVYLTNDRKLIGSVYVAYNNRTDLIYNGKMFSFQSDN